MEDFVNTTVSLKPKNSIKKKIKNISKEYDSIINILDMIDAKNSLISERKSNLTLCAEKENVIKTKWYMPQRFLKLKPIILSVGVMLPASLLAIILFPILGEVNNLDTNYRIMYLIKCCLVSALTVLFVHSYFQYRQDGKSLKKLFSNIDNSNEQIEILTQSIQYELNTLSKKFDIDSPSLLNVLKAFYKTNNFELNNSICKYLEKNLNDIDLGRDSFEKINKTISLLIIDSQRESSDYVNNLVFSVNGE